MSITKRPFDTTAGGQAVTEYTMTNAAGASVSMIDFGAIITKIIVPDRDGRLADVNLGYDCVDTYDGKGGSMGATIGRVGNRIAGATFELEGQTYTLGANNGPNNLHGGPRGFGVQMWSVEAAKASGGDALTFAYTSPDGDQGFPGTLKVTATYSWNDACELGIHYHATTDQTTLVNLTNHAYFNLDGHDAPTVENLTLRIFADYITEVREGLIPTGKLIPVSQVPFGFDAETRLGDVLAHTDTCPAMKMAGGVDFNYCAGRDRETKLIAVLRSPKTGRVMETYTDQPGVQCYTGQGLNHTGKGGVHYGPFAGVCLETQHYQDSIHHPHFPSIVLRPQDVYDSVTTYRFRAE